MKRFLTSTARLIATGALAGLVVGTSFVPEARAQFRLGRPTLIGSGARPINRNWLAGPGLSLRQAAWNTRKMGRALRSVPPYWRGYNPYGPIVADPGFGYAPTGDGDFLQGAADVIRSQGQLSINLQQAKVVGEQAKELAIANRRRLFDEIMYERMNTPSFTELKEQEQALRLRRAQGTAPATEVWSARALNDLLADLKKLRGQEIHGPDIQLDQDLLRRINIQGGSRSGHLGVLRDGGRMTWPLGLCEVQPARTGAQLRSRLERHAREAFRQATAGKIHFSVIKELRATADRLRQLLVKNVAALEANVYMEAKRYMNDLDEALKVLTRPDVANYFNQTYVARGETVRELVDHMTRKGLTFAPATSGDEAAYEALHQALVGYNLGARGRASQMESERRPS